MRLQRLMCRFVCAAAAVISEGQTSALAVLYSQNFDANDTANWAVNNNGAGTNAANFFFDYSSVGVPSAPHSGGSTRGLKLGANLSSATAPASGAIPGLSVSPIGKSFTGNYELAFDWWSNYLGPLGASPSSSTQLSTFGVLTSGNVANYDGQSDGVFFGATGNGGVPAGPDDGDFGAYSSERPTGYARPIDVINDAHAIYFAEDPDDVAPRDNLDEYYTAIFPGGRAAPIVQSQAGVTPAGTVGFQWHQVEIEKIGDVVTWKVDGAPIAAVLTTGFTVPTGGTNIMLGHSDVNLSTSSNSNFATLQFTLIDNVRVLSLAGDYDHDGDVDDDDYDVWKATYGAVGPGNDADGNGDNLVDAADYTVWRNNFTPLDLMDMEGGGGVALAVPEPAAILLIGQLLGLLLMMRRRVR